MIFGSKFGCLGLQKQAFGKGGIAKINFLRNWISYDSRVNFSCFWVALGRIFMCFDTLEVGLKFDGFSCLPRGTPRSKQPAWLVVTRRFLALDSKTIEPET